jgi:hypothetical protein
MTGKGHEVVVKELPKCQFCDDQAAFDGRTVHGPWAFMCQAHWDEHGVGHTGVGYGQRLIHDPGYTIQCGTCFMCGETSTLKIMDAILADRINAWMSDDARTRPFVQDAFPDLDAGQRELLMTGTHDECFEAAFGNDRD